MSAIRTTLSLAVLAAATGLMLSAATDTSFARGGPHGPQTMPTCNGSCQANKAKPPTTVANGKTRPGSGGAPNTGGRNYQQQ
jgi:hypothetical protein